MKNVLITGGAGFMGANFVYYAIQEHPDWNITVLDALTYAGNIDNLKSVLSKINFIKCNINDKRCLSDIFRENLIDTVIHFAAETHVDRSILYPKQFIKTNIEGTYNLLSVGLKYDIERFHHISTDEVYGSLLDYDMKSVEEDQYLPNSPYSATKAASDHIVRSFGHTYGLPYTISHSCNNFGPYQFPEKLIPMAMNCFIHDIPLPVHGTGRQIRDWLHVYHNSTAIDLILHKGTVGECYNISGENEMSVIEIVQKIADIFYGLTNKCVSHLITLAPERPGQDYRYALDSSKLVSLGWDRPDDVITQLIDTVKWYIHNQDWLCAARNSPSYKSWLKKSYFKKIAEKKIYNPIGAKNDE